MDENAPMRASRRGFLGGLAGAIAVTGEQSNGDRSLSTRR
jgi:hypothetical protein